MYRRGDRGVYLLILAQMGIPSDQYQEDWKSSLRGLLGVYLVMKLLTLGHNAYLVS